MSNHLRAPIQESHRSLGLAAAYAVGGALVFMGGYALLDAGPTIQAQSNARVTLVRLGACERGDRSLDFVETVDMSGRPSEAAYCGDVVVMYQADGVTPDWQATRAPAERQFKQNLLLPDADEIMPYQAVGALGAIAGLGFLEVRIKKPHP